jgi:hypothetical protein
MRQGHSHGVTTRNVRLLVGTAAPFFFVHPGSPCPLSAQREPSRQMKKRLEIQTLHEHHPNMNDSTIANEVHVERHMVAKWKDADHVSDAPRSGRPLNERPSWSSV